jgi:thiamine-monophosphate kinase
VTTPLGPGKEFDIVRALIAQFGDAAGAIGDDAAPFEVPEGETLLVSTDTTVENVHFRPAWLSPQEVGYRAVMAAMSDLAAMGATPRAVVVAWTLPEWWRIMVDPLAEGIRDAALECNAKIVGGDLSNGPVLSLGVTVIGSARRVLRRSGARAGDAVFVTGWLGGAALALRAFETRFVPDARVRERFARPTARLKEGAWLAAHGATSAIDISDGLAADLGHIAAASNVHIGLDIERLPLFGEATFDDAATSGEEYELAVTGPIDLDTDGFLNEFGITLTRVGSVIAGPPAVEARRNGARIRLPRGYDHFAP